MVVNALGLTVCYLSPTTWKKAWLEAQRSNIGARTGPDRYGTVRHH